MGTELCEIKLRLVNNANDGKFRRAKFVSNDEILFVQRRNIFVGNNIEWNLREAPIENFGDFQTFKRDGKIISPFDFVILIIILEMR